MESTRKDVIHTSSRRLREHKEWEERIERPSKESGSRLLGLGSSVQDGGSGQTWMRQSTDKVNFRQGKDGGPSLRRIETAGLTLEECHPSDPKGRKAWMDQSRESRIERHGDLVR